MIGHYLLTLTREQEGRALTGKMAALYRWTRDGISTLHRNDTARCLLMVVHECEGWEISSATRTANWQHRPGTFLGAQYDHLCGRFGTERVNAAIRNRILSNIARRELAGVRELVG